jgi:hypothetical protein
MIAAILAVSYVTALVALADEIRRPASAWVAADRNRGFWITITIVLGLLGCGVLVAVAYLLIVIPGFAAGDRVDSAFRKQRS